MIQANELRIGNCVDGGKAGLIRIAKICPGSVDRIGQHYDIGYFSNGDINYPSILKLEDINPIAITTDILKQFGFFHDEDAYNWKKPHFKIWKCFGFWIGQKDNSFFHYHQAENDEFSNYYPELFSVHQMQNLCFFYDGQELQFENDTAISQ